MSNHSIDLNTFASGGMAELFNAEMQKVYENIKDPNTAADAARIVTVTIKIKPDKDRDVAPASVQVKSSLAPREPVTTKIMVGRDEQGYVRGGELKSGAPGQLFIDQDGDIAKDDGEKLGEETTVAENVTQLKKRFK